MKLGRAAPAILLVMLLPGAAAGKPPAPDPDPWFGPDKQLHFALSTMITGAGYGTSALFTDQIAARVALGAGLGLTAGATKELLDLAGLGDPSWKDLAWDAMGTAVGVWIAITLDVATRSPRSAVVR